MGQLSKSERHMWQAEGLALTSVRPSIILIYLWYFLHTATAVGKKKLGKKNATMHNPGPWARLSQSLLALPMSSMRKTTYFLPRLPSLDAIDTRYEILPKDILSWVVMGSGKTHKTRPNSLGKESVKDSPKPKPHIRWGKIVHWTTTVCEDTNNKYPVEDRRVSKVRKMPLVVEKKQEIRLNNHESCKITWIPNPNQYPPQSNFC
jgi:hypothetical protein